MRRLLLTICLYVAAAFAFGTYFAANAKAQSAPAVWIKQYKIEHEGMTFMVEGYRRDSGSVTWEPSRPFNARSYAEAVAARQRGPENGQTAGDPFPGGVALNLIGNPGYHALSDEGRRFVKEVQAQGGDPEMLHVTVIGKPEDRTAVLKDLDTHPALAKMRQNLLVQYYSPSEWAVDTRAGFPAHGTPSILIQLPRRSRLDPKGGKVLWRSENYNVGPEGLAEAIRKADPNRDPEKDPGPVNKSKGGKCPLGFNSTHWPYIVGAIALLYILVKLPRKAG